MRIRSFVSAGGISLLLLLSLSSFPAVGRAEFDPVIDSPMYQSPAFPGPPVEVIFPEELKPLWLRALQRPEADLRCKAAETIARARQRGMRGLETTVGPLLEALDQAGQTGAVRLAVAQALIALDAREAAPSLLRHAQSGPGELREVIEPALARWKYQPAGAVWLARLDDAKAAPHSLTLAIRGLAALGEAQAVERLRQLALSDQSDRTVRVEAGRALAALVPEGLEKDAETLLAGAAGSGLVPRLVAASLLRRHRGDRAVALLQRLAADEEPAVAALALARLVELDMQLVVPMLGGLLANPDAGLRLVAIEVLTRHPDEKKLGLLGDRIADPHLDVRRQARRSLLALAERKDLRSPVIRQGERLLAGGDWRGQEQATMLLAQLDHKPAGPRLVELLTSERPEVYVTAAWGLRRLGNPETLPAVVRHVDAEERHFRAVTNPNAVILVDHKLSQLNQLLGQQRHAPAERVLRRFVPRMGPPPFGQESRAAAIWALGLLHEGKPDHDLAKALEERLNDSRSIPPEDLRVRSMSAIAIGRMQAKECLPSLRSYFPEIVPPRSLLNNACGWAIQQQTGEAMPPQQTVRPLQRDWFLVPDR
jgi:HEAT repeat protein